MFYLTNSGIFNSKLGAIFTNRGQFIRSMTDLEKKSWIENSVKIEFPNKNFQFDDVTVWEHIATLEEYNFEKFSSNIEGTVKTTNYVFQNKTNNNQIKLLQIFEFEDGNISFDNLVGVPDMNVKLKKLVNVQLNDGSTILVETSKGNNTDTQFPVELAFVKEKRRNLIYNIFFEVKQNFENNFFILTDKIQLLSIFDWVNVSVLKKDKSFFSKLFKMKNKYRR